MEKNNTPITLLIHLADENDPSNGEWDKHVTQIHNEIGQDTNIKIKNAALLQRDDTFNEYFPIAHQYFRKV